MTIGVMREKCAHIVVLLLFGVLVAAAREALVECARKLCNCNNFNFNLNTKSAQLTVAVFHAKVLVCEILVMRGQVQRPRE